MEKKKKKQMGGGGGKAKNTRMLKTSLITFLLTARTGFWLLESGCNSWRKWFSVLGSKGPPIAMQGKAFFRSTWPETVMMERQADGGAESVTLFAREEGR